MKSTASIKGHPIHPMLIAFPIAFFIGTLLVDILTLVIEGTDFSTTGTLLNIGGIAFALLAAVPGIIDYVKTVPPDSSAKKRATKHGVANVTVVIIFAVALWLRKSEETSMLWIIALEAVAVALLTAAGWMGGTLVYRNQIGVNPRYAHAGKWKEERTEKTTGLIEAGKAGELKVNQMKLLHIGDKRVVLCKTENGYAAFSDYCSHRGGSLAGGAMICGTVQCPWHGSQFDVNTGAVKAGPAKDNITTYAVSESDGKVFITL